MLKIQMNTRKNVFALLHFRHYEYNVTVKGRAFLQFYSSVNSYLQNL